MFDAVVFFVGVVVAAAAFLSHVVVAIAAAAAAAVVDVVVFHVFVCVHFAGHVSIRVIAVVVVAYEILLVLNNFQKLPFQRVVVLPNIAAALLNGAVPFLAAVVDRQSCTVAVAAAHVAAAPVAPVALDLMHLADKTFDRPKHFLRKPMTFDAFVLACLAKFDRCCSCSWHR